MADIDILREYFLWCTIQNEESYENESETREGPDETPKLSNSFDPNKMTSKMIKCEKTWKIFMDNSYDTVALKAYFNSKTDEERAEIFRFGMACLISFAQCNFTGPDFDQKTQDFLKGSLFTATDYSKMLSVNNEDINTNTKFPVLLITAKIIFEWCIINTVVNIWWYWRALYLHQQILDELSPTLLSEADRLFKLLQANLPKSDIITVPLHLEVSQLYLLFRNISKAKEVRIAAQPKLGMNYEYVGVMGKKTKFQENDVPLLTVKITSNSVEKNEAVDQSSLPQNVALDDDILLDHINWFKSNDSDKEMSNLHQKWLIMTIQEALISKPQDELHQEELYPLIREILSQKNSFCVRVVALLLRCKLEGKNRRTIERSLKQAEEVLHSFKKEKPEIADRVFDVFGCGMQPMWKVENQYADFLLNLGLVKNALDIYLKLELWEDVIICYTILKLRHKAAEIIKKCLEEKPTVKMWCLLGDATDDVSCYEKAWDLSKRRSHRAQRHWGQFLFLRKQYEECIPHFEKSVSINPLQANVWFRLGYAALQVENWQTAATAYKRYTTLEPEGYEAWNNLAQAYLKLGNKRAAHQALLEAVRCNFEHWKVWENFLVISSDISMYSDVIRSYHRLLDLKEKYLNVHVLAELVYDVIDQTIDYEGLPASRFLPKTRELLGRVLSIYPVEAELWDLFAKVAPTTILKLQRYLRAYKAYTSNNQWVKDLKTCQEVIYVCFKFAELGLLQEIDDQNAILNSIKLSTASAISALKKQDWEETRECVERLQLSLDMIIEKIKAGNEK